MKMTASELERLQSSVQVQASCSNNRTRIAEVKLDYVTIVRRSHQLVDTATCHVGNFIETEISLQN